MKQKLKKKQAQIGELLQEKWVDVHKDYNHRINKVQSRSLKCEERDRMLQSHFYNWNKIVSLIGNPQWAEFGNNTMHHSTQSNSSKRLLIQNVRI